MKKAIFLLVTCCLMTACSSEKKTSKDPIENLVAYLDEQDPKLVHRQVRYDGGSILRTNVSYSIHGEEEIIDSCFNAFRWGCSSARKCYHKENHVLNKDTVLYALALDALEGERIELQNAGDQEYYNLRFNAARAATLRYNAGKNFSDMWIEYIIREEKGREYPFNMRPLNDFIKWMMEEVDSVKVYETSYEYTIQDAQGNPSLLGECWYDEEHTMSGKTTGHLYVVPKASADLVEESLKFRVKNEYLGSYPNQAFTIILSYDEVFISRNMADASFSVNKTFKHEELRGMKSVDGHYYVLVLDETTGAFCIPFDWKHTLRIKDHKAELIPGAHKPNKDGWID